MKIRVGSRTSALARHQADRVMEQLHGLYPDLDLEWVGIRTGGDADRQTPLAALGGAGVFVKELEQALLDDVVDMAVHSLKDMPIRQPDGLVLGAVTQREDARDAIVCRPGATWRTLPAGSVVGTSSPRRCAQLKSLRPDVSVVSIRGNIETRLSRTKNGEVDAVMLAYVGLKRLALLDGLNIHCFPVHEFLPAPGQGCVAVECRSTREVMDRLQGLHHGRSAACVSAERALLEAMGGGCSLPVGAFAMEENGVLRLDGLVGAPETGRIIRARVSGAVDAPTSCGRKLAMKLLDMGADAFLAT